MTLRAVSANSSWLTPLAVLVPILAMVAAAAWALSVWPPLILLAVAGGLAVTALAGRHTYGTRTALATAGLTLVAAVVALFISLAVIESSSICGKAIPDSWRWIPFVAGGLVYFALGTYGLRTNRAHSVVPLALFGGVIAALVLMDLVPGTAGYCD